MLATALLLPRQDMSADAHDFGSHIDAYAKLIGQLHFYLVACFAVFVWDVLVGDLSFFSSFLNPLTDFPLCTSYVDADYTPK